MSHVSLINLFFNILFSFLFWYFFLSIAIISITCLSNFLDNVIIIDFNLFLLLFFRIFTFPRLTFFFNHLIGFFLLSRKDIFFLIIIMIFRIWRYFVAYSKRFYLQVEFCNYVHHSKFYIHLYRRTRDETIIVYSKLYFTLFSIDWCREKKFRRTIKRTATILSLSVHRPGKISLRNITFLWY